MLYHTRLVVRGTERAFVIGDLPFMTYNISADQALANAARFLQQAGAQSVKLEGPAYSTNYPPLGGEWYPRDGPYWSDAPERPSARRMACPGQNEGDGYRLIDDARAVEDAGAYAVVLELVPAELRH